MSNNEYIQSLMLYLSQGAGALILTIILYRFYKNYRHEYLLSWSLSWLGFAVYLVGASISYSLIDVIPPNDSIRLFITLGSLWFGYFQLVFLLKGTFEVSTKGPVNSKVVSLSLILVLVASVIFVFTNLDNQDAMARVLVRAGFRSIISGLSFLIAAILISRSTLVTKGLGVKLVFWTFLIYGIQQFHYAMAIIMGYNGNFAMFGFTVYLGVIDLLIQSLMGVGMLVWLLEDESRELKKANKDLDSLVYSTSHDLRAPLASILGLLNVTKLEKDQDKILEYFEMIEGRIKKLDRIIGDIMVFSQNSKVEVKVEKFLVKGAISETLDDLQFMKGFDTISIDIDVQPGTTVKSDKDRFKIILNNLLSNSIKYRRNIEPWIRISAHRMKDKFILEIEDNGVGIEEAHLPRIFEMFYRASQDSDGSGLGLYIVNEAVERLDGRIKVESDVKKGTKFHIEFPG